MQIQSDDEDLSPVSPGKKKKIAKFEEEEKKSGYKFWCDSCGSDEELHMAKQTVLRKQAKMKNRGLSPDRKGTHKLPTRANTEKLPKSSLEVSENAKTYKKVKTLGKGEGFAVYVVESQDSEKAVMK